MTEKQTDEAWMALALQEAEKAFHLGEVPVGCVIVQQEKIIGRGHNQRESLQDPTAHAEILALQEAARNVGQWRILDATVYVTLEPCPMCAGALLNARISRLVYGCPDPKAGACGSLMLLGQDARFNHQYLTFPGVLAEPSSILLKTFFQQRRKKKPEATEKTELD